MYKPLAIWASVLLLTSCQPPSSEEVTSEEPTVPTHLPFHEVGLEDLSSFAPVAANWSIAGRVISDHTERHHLETKEGTGILVNQNDDQARDNLFTQWEHGDLELDLEVMVPKGSNSGIYLQGRYEIQLFDSWGKQDPAHSDCGGIYQRWDESRPEGQRGYEGHAPRSNASKAPGLWQHFYIVFRAPRFDETGEKLSNAMFEKVELNGVLIHENVALFGPTRAAAFEDEAAEGPLMIQGDHGPVALRNIRYKRYFDQQITLNRLEYKYYEVEGPITALPVFESLTAVQEGTTDSLIPEKLSERVDEVAYIFEGEIQVPVSGDYLFHLYSDDGSKLYVNGDLLIDNDGKHDFEEKRAVITLDEGPHTFTLPYFNNTWGRGLLLLYEGPEMKLQPLAGQMPERRTSDRPNLTITPEQEPEMVRSFVMHGDEKITHAMSVGHPEGIHYSVDLRRGALLKFWRGRFADVTEMWYRRGQPQLLQPLEMAVEISASLVASVLASSAEAYPEERGTSLQFKGYDVGDDGRPTLRYQLNDAVVTSHYHPSPDGLGLAARLHREAGSGSVYSRVASSDYVEEVHSGLFSIGGKYYLQLDPGSQPVIREMDGQVEVLLPLSGEVVEYSLLW